MTLEGDFMEKNYSNVRKPVFAGSFYPSSKKGVLTFLQNMDDTYSDTHDVLKEQNFAEISGLIVPHAGWIYSGKTAMAAYRLLKGIKPKKIVILGPSHHIWINSAVRDVHDAWETPLGVLPLINDEDFEPSFQAHEKEHSLEVQIPFIQYFVPDCTILPLVVGQLLEKQVESLSEKLLNKDYFFIISTDLSHFYPIAEAHKRDLQTIDNIEALREEGTEACGIQPLRVAFAMMRKDGKKPHLINYSTSAEVSGDSTSVVGYASFWF